MGHELWALSYQPSAFSHQLLGYTNQGGGSSGCFAIAQEYTTFSSSVDAVGGMGNHLDFTFFCFRRREIFTVNSILICLTPREK
jgi:hypothetical protein